jgi:hypothetical protein
MAISKKNREVVRLKFGGKCAYTGTALKDDWQVDHIKPKINYRGVNCDDIENLFPAQRIVNHYKGALPLDVFRNWFLGGLSDRLKKLPKNPKVASSVKKKAYLLEVAALFGITEDKPFSGKFYFENTGFQIQNNDSTG